MRYVKVNKFAELTGYTPKAVYNKMSEGVFIEGVHYRRAPDNVILLDLEAYERWVEGGQGSASRSEKTR